MRGANVLPVAALGAALPAAARLSARPLTAALARILRAPLVPVLVGARALFGFVALLLVAALPLCVARVLIRILIVHICSHARVGPGADDASSRPDFD